MWLPPVLSYMHHYSPNLDTSPCHGAPLFSSHNIALYSPTLLYTLYCHTIALHKTLKQDLTVCQLSVCVWEREREFLDAPQH